MRIALVNDRGEGGGTERYLSTLAHALAAKGHIPLLLTGTPAPDTKGRPEGRTLPALRDGSPSPGGVGSVRGALEAFDPDAVLLNNLPSPRMMRGLMGLAPTAGFLHVPSYFCPGGAKFWRSRGLACDVPYSPRCLVYAWSRQCAPRSPVPCLFSYRRTGDFLDVLGGMGRMIVASRHMAAEIARTGLTARVSVLPVPVDASESLLPLPEAPVVLFTGRLVFEKGCHVLLEAMRVLPLPLRARTRLRIAGEGPERPRLEKLAGGLDVAFLGWLSPEAVRRELAAARVLAMPSLWPEPFGMSGPEAMAQGRPVAASRVGGISEWLSDGRTGILVPPGDAEALAWALATLLPAGGPGAAMGREGWETARSSLSPDRHVEGLLKVFLDA